MTEPMLLALYEEAKVDNAGEVEQYEKLYEPELRSLGLSQIVYISNLPEPVKATYVKKGKNGKKDETVEVVYLSKIEMSNGDTFYYRYNMSDTLYRIANNLAEK